MSTTVGRHSKGTQSSGDDEQTTVWWWVRTIASWMLLAVMVGVLAAMVVVPRLSGSTAFTVLTGSMEPTMPPGTLIVVKPTPADQLQTGQVITFQPQSGDPEVVTHRIDGIFYNGQGERRIYTRGDANNVRDPWALEAGQIRGRVWYAVPYLGRVNLLFSGADSRATLIKFAGGALAVYAVWMIAGGLKERSRRSGDGDDNSQIPADTDVTSPVRPAETTETK